MDNDPRKLLLLNRISIMGDKPDLQSHDFSTHVHMSWPGFYDSISHVSQEDALVLLFSPNIAFDNSGVLLNVGQIEIPNAIPSLQGGSDDKSNSTIH